MEIIMQLSVGRQKINAEKLYITEAGTCRSIHISGVFADSDGSIGNMWECPNFVQIGNTDVLIISPKGLEKENGFSASFESGYMTGKMNYEEGMVQVMLRIKN